MGDDNLHGEGEVEVSLKIGKTDHSCIEGIIHAQCDECILPCRSLESLFQMEKQSVPMAKIKFFDNVIDSTFIPRMKYL